MCRIFSFALITLALTSAGCSREAKANHAGGAANRSAPNLMIQYGCPTCHVISGVPGAVGKVGPPLESLGQRSYLAGTLSNTPGNLEHWLMHPQSIHPGTAMPEMGVTPADAREIGKFLYDRR
jgi:cytochrome c